VAVLSGNNALFEADELRGLADVVHVPVDRWSSVPADVLQRADAALVWRMSSMADQEALAAFERLRVLVRVGVGYDSIDLGAAARSGVAVCNVPAYGVEEVADTAMAHILGLYRRTHLLASRVASGAITSSLNSVVQREAAGATRVRGQRLGIVGLGRIGTAVALRAQAFGFSVGFYDPQLPDGADKALGGLRRFEAVEVLLEQSDCVSLHCTYNPSSHHIIDEAALHRLPTGALVVNTARGGLIDDAALAAALEAGRLGGAALDCQEVEPAVGGSVYLELLRRRAGAVNLILTPHSSFYSDQSVVQMRQMASAEASRALQVRLGGNASAEAAVEAVTGALRNCVNGGELTAHAPALRQRWGLLP
tara:strand:+ start:363 stop:1457 length:1095 start_codon:yes stop_codon:yes gene_type:complete